MATNPKLPEKRQHAELQVHLRQNAPRSGAPWVLIALVVAAAILIALVAFLPRVPKTSGRPASSEIPAQPTGGQIQFSNVRLVSSPEGGALALDALMTNAGGTEVTGVAVEGKFTDKDGRVVGSQQANVMGIEGKTAGVTQNLTQAPVKPNEQRPVRIVFDRIPASWDHQPPALTVTTVTAAGEPTTSKGVSPNVKGVTIKPGKPSPAQSHK